ncbi:Rieske (2Fe-2S) protein [Maritimibacter sp. UBA3975]|uniref:Rieske (2Fe-2S) protein n=1 Tax=Maritimibacter sp. UBA3975 TaxID=1946833 RepID=UPI000C0B8D6E|nr:Rieske (2Fe-2S) protein [Maritimibacter sp. UBA3975]MAM61328.1 (2Fe-2S)-binding protein [Maritimibacter sp.]|tara:strand:+ start:1096 stop:1422 length:327 start_codon:yes stop_codon:yes gene_type:complete
MLPGGQKDFQDACSTMQVPKTGVFFTTIGSQEVMLARDPQGEIVAFSGFCTHSFGKLEGGDVEGGEITCPHHGARFDIRTGKAKSACPNLPKFDVKIEGRRVLVKPNR